MRDTKGVNLDGMGGGEELRKVEEEKYEKKKI